MRFEHFCMVIPFLECGKATRAEMLVTYSEVIGKGMSSFNGAVFWLKAYSILERTDTRGVFLINKDKLVEFVKKNHSSDSIKKIEANYGFFNKGWWAKYGRILEGLLA